MGECRDMGLGTLGRENTVFKRKFRWMLTIAGIVGEGVNIYPPNSAGRPKLTFNDFQANHVVETITIPGRPVWNPITLTVYDITQAGAVGVSGRHPIYEWILSLYGTHPNTSGSGGLAAESDNFPYKWSGSKAGEGGSISRRFKRPQAFITMYDGCGIELERWTLENVWPSEVDFGELDMGSSDVSMITMTLKYDRAYLEILDNPTN